MYICPMCSIKVKDPSNLKKVECPSCSDPSKNFSYLCNKCIFPLIKLK